MGFPRDSPRFSPYAAWRWLLFLVCHVVRFTSAADEPSNPGTGPLTGDTPDAKRTKNGPGFHERQPQKGGSKPGSAASIKLSQRYAARGRGGRGAKRSFNFQGRGSGPATSLPNPSAPAAAAPTADAPGSSDIPATSSTNSIPSQPIATAAAAPAAPAPAVSDIPATSSPTATTPATDAPCAPVPAASDIPAKCPWCGHPEPSASPLGSEGAGPSSAPTDPTGDTSHRVYGNSNYGSSSTQPLPAPSAPCQVVEGVGTASVSGSWPRLVPLEADDSVEAPKRVTSAAPDAADARFKAVLKAALIQRLLLLLSLSLVLNLLHFFLSKLNPLQPSY
jgi:hypothetical protein